jgi:hypothetical protein
VRDYYARSPHVTMLGGKNVRVTIFHKFRYTFLDSIYSTVNKEAIAS